MSLFKLTGGTVYDPAHGIDGQVRDLWIEDDKIVAPPCDSQQKPARELDLRGLIVMPGGIDMHCHIAGPKVNTARKMRPEEKRGHEVVPRTDRLRSGTLGSVPSTFATAYKYAGMGYTTAFDAAISPLAARHVHEEFRDLPGLDKGFFVLCGNNQYVLQCLHDREPEKLRGFLAWLLNATKGYALKIVNPGGVERWKSQSRGNVHSLDDLIEAFEITPRQILRELARAADDLRLPHSVHIHCNNLGLPGNWRTTLQSMEALEGARGHLTHIQFHSYGGGDEDEGSLNSKVQPLVDYVNAHENLTIDVGQVLFGSTTSMTGDGPVGHYLHRIYGAKWFSYDTELESGCGIVPIEYKNKSLVHGIQWAIGLEWYLLAKDPWRVVMSTDHPNGASFRAYPQIIRLLMDRGYRQQVLAQLHPLVRERTQLADLTREYTLQEICIITRAAPARILGLTHKGHLGPGADADVVVYTPHEDQEWMFQLPRHVIKAGQLIVENGDLRIPHGGKTLYVAPEYDPSLEAPIADWFEHYYSLRFRNYPVSLETLDEPEAVACGPRATRPV